MRFTKMQGVGNDFVLVDGFDEPERDWAALAPLLCARHTGVGADGLLIVGPGGAGCDLSMRMFNPDGSPDVCGNGLRCVTRYALESGRVTDSTMTIQTAAGPRRSVAHLSDAGDFDSVTVDMGAPQFRPPDIPMAVDAESWIERPITVPGYGSLTLTAVSTGSTHAVHFGDEPLDEGGLATVGAAVEHHGLFPERTSLMWCRMSGANQVEMQIWERGGGETLGCGTGACAAAVAAIATGRASREAPVAVTSRGGRLEIRWREDGDVEMTGPAERVFGGTVDLEAIALGPVA